MLLMPQIFDVTANENARYKRYELELFFVSIYKCVTVMKFYAPICTKTV